MNTVREVVPQLIAYGKILRPILGIERASDQWIRRNNIEEFPSFALTVASLPMAPG